MSSVAAALLSSCSGAPDRRGDADELERVISVMAGVQHLDVGYTNNFERGASLNLRIDMRSATSAEIEAVATRINEIKGDRFDAFEQAARFTIGSQLTLTRRATLEPAQIAADTQRLRQIRAALPVGEIAGDHPRDAVLSISVTKVAAADPVLSAARTALTSEPAQVSIIIEHQSPVWKVTYPFTADDEHRVRATLSQLPITSDPTVVEVDHGHLSDLSIRVDTVDPYRELTTIIELTQPSPDHPLMLRWHAGVGATFAGYADIYGCRGYGDYDAARHPEKHYTADAVALQTRMRSAYDTCPK